MLGLEVVTPRGDLVKTGGKTIKSVTGYDLTRLYTGSEGTLGSSQDLPAADSQAGSDQDDDGSFPQLDDATRTVTLLVKRGSSR